MTYFDTYYHGKRIGNRIRPRLASRKSIETILIHSPLLPGSLSLSLSPLSSFPLSLSSFKLYRSLILLFISIQKNGRHVMHCRKERKPNYDLNRGRGNIKIAYSKKELFYFSSFQKRKNYIWFVFKSELNYVRT